MRRSSRVRTKLRGYYDLSRPGNVVAAGVLTAIGALVAGGGTEHLWPVIAAVVATSLAVAAGNAINDYFDREIDATNRPDRPIPRGDIAPREALAFSLLLFAIAVALALTLPLAAIVIAVINLFALVAYTEWFKGLPGVGNLVVAGLTGSTFLFGGAAIGEPFGAVILAILAAIATLTREIIKDVEDVEGDRQEGLNTLPIAIGERNALYLSAVAIVVGVVASVVPYLDGTFGLAYLVAIVPADVVMVWAMKRSFSDPATGQRYLKLGMFIAAGAFLLGRLEVVL